MFPSLFTSFLSTTNNNNYNNNQVPKNDDGKPDRKSPVGLALFLVLIAIQGLVGLTTFLLIRWMVSRHRSGKSFPGFFKAHSNEPPALNLLGGGAAESTPSSSSSPKPTK